MIDWSNFNSCLLIEVTRPTGVFTSSAVAINSTTILTAAHCLEGEILKVRVTNDRSYSKTGKFFKVKSFDLHPDYDSSVSNYKCDIAKIILAQELPADTTFYPIIKENKELTGNFLRLGYGARVKENIRTLITPVIKSFCFREKVLELRDMFSYSGDSGGPIFMQSQGQMYLVAVHSTLSFGPEGKHSYNPLLSQHRKWINSNE
jgi:secreted trypsin-like serine protease